MNKKIKFISITILIIICISIIIFGVYNLYSNEYSTDIKLEFFLKIAENKTSCSDIRNELYLIDNNMVFYCMMFLYYTFLPLVCITLT